MSDAFWRKCATCKKPIAFDSVYWVCNVSTCNRRPLELVFCTIDCWDAHVPTMRHKESWAEERRSPRRGAANEPQRPEKAKRRVSMHAKSEVKPAQSSPGLQLEPAPPDEVLVVASKVKAYIKARSGMNTAAAVMEALSSHVRAICDSAIKSAAQHERKTVLERDVP